MKTSSRRRDGFSQRSGGFPFTGHRPWLWCCPASTEVERLDCDEFVDRSLLVVDVEAITDTVARHEDDQDGSRYRFGCGARGTCRCLLEGKRRRRPGGIRSDEQRGR